MTKRRRELLKCPDCGRNEEVELFESINVTLHPELKKKLFNCEINVFNCSHCGFRAFVPLSLMYHDMESKICVQYYPEEILETEDIYKFFTEDGKLKLKTENVEEWKELVDIMEQNMPEYIRALHVVFDMRELVRYVYFRERLAEYYRNMMGDS